jgi:hypothetical protein
MRNIAFLSLTCLMILSACSASPAAAATPPVPTVKPTLAPAATKVPPTATPLPKPTPTPQPVAVPLVYKGWEDKAFSRVCVDALNIMTEFDIAGIVKPAVSRLLQAMGIEILPPDGDCEAFYAMMVSMETEAQTLYFSNGETCTWLTGAEFTGDLVFMAPPGGDGFTIPLKGSYKATGIDIENTPKESSECDESTELPLEVITKSVLEAFLKIYGDRALAAALTMPEFQAAALELQK